MSHAAKDRVNCVVRLQPEVDSLSFRSVKLSFKENSDVSSLRIVFFVVNFCEAHGLQGYSRYKVLLEVAAIDTCFSSGKRK